MKVKKTGVITKIVVAALALYAMTTLLSLHSQIASAEAEKEELQSRIEEQTQTNESLRNDIENKDDPEKIEEIAREKLGLVSEGERVFYDVSK